MRILLPTLHVRRSAQAVALAAGNLKANLPKTRQARTELLDLFCDQPLAEQLGSILAKQPQLVAFPLYLWNRQTVLELCRRLRRELPGVQLFAGGPEASADAATVLAEGTLDGVICGEGELVFAELVEHLSRSRELPPLPGLLTSAEPGKQVTPASCPDLSQLNSPWLSGCLPLTEGCGVLWEVARGCPFNCAFCFDAKGQRGVRPLPLARLRAELQLFAERRVDQIWVLDSTFNAPAKRGRQLLQLLLELGQGIHFHLEAKADFLDAESARLLGQLACSVQIGLQSANPDILQPLHRSLQPAKLTRALRQLTAHGVTYGLDLIYGLPGDNHQGFADSLDFALRQQPNQIDIFPLAVLPGTELYERQDSFGLSGESQPPYLLQQNRSYPENDLARSRQLADATDIFYNRGRAVGFFLQFCEALKLSPVDFLETFGAWRQGRPEFARQEEDSADVRQAENIRSLQLNFIREQFQTHQKAQLLPLAEDLLNYHYCCAETLLAAECLSDSRPLSTRQLLSQRWRLNPAVQLQFFNYHLEALEAAGGEKLGWLYTQLPAEPGYGIFLNQQGQLISEALDDDFSGLLCAADGGRSTEQLLSGLERENGLEWLQFAVRQGLLLAT